MPIIAKHMFNLLNFVTLVNFENILLILIFIFSLSEKKSQFYFTGYPVLCVTHIWTVGKKSLGANTIFELFYLFRVATSR